MPRRFSSGRRSASMPGQRLDERGLAVVDVAGRPDRGIASRPDRLTADALGDSLLAMLDRGSRRI